MIKSKRSLKEKFVSFKSLIKQKVAKMRLYRLNKRINRLDLILNKGVDLKLTNELLKQFDKKLKERKEQLLKKYEKILKPIKKLQKFDEQIESYLKGDVDFEDLPLIVKVGTGLIVANALIESSYTIPQVSYVSTVYPTKEHDWKSVDWTSYDTEVSGIKYKRRTVSGAAINNPMNIRPPKKSSYEGQVGKKEVYRRDGTSVGYFAIFSDPYYSFKAAARQIIRYRDADAWESKRKELGATKGNLTVFQMLNIYAPPKDFNNPRSYANSVMRYSDGKIKPNDYLKIDTDKEQFKYLLRAMARVENEAIVDLDYLDKVWESIYGSGAAPLQTTLKSPIFSVQVSSKRTNRKEGVNNVQSTGAQPSNVQVR